MEKLEQIIQNAEKEVSRIVGYPVKLSILTNTNEHFETYAKIWDIIFGVVRKELASNKKLNLTNTLADYYKVYVLVCNKKIISIDIKTCMQVIGKDRTTYYHTLQTALGFLNNKDERFMPRFTTTIATLKMNGYESFEI